MDKPLWRLLRLVRPAFELRGIRCVACVRAPSNHLARGVGVRSQDPIGLAVDLFGLKDDVVQIGHCLISNSTTGSCPRAKTTHFRPGLLTSHCSIAF